MPGTTTQFKLGLFALAALAGIVATAVGLGLRGARVETIRYHTYFDETAQGLELGSPVKYRGVRIGNVADISIAPDRKFVAVGLAIDRDAVARLGLVSPAPGLRTQLVIQGITGVKFIDMDFIDPKAYPPPVLGFPPGRNYIPSRPSLIKGLEGRLGPVVRDLPSVLDSMEKTLDKLGRVFDDVREHQVVERLAQLVDNVDATNRQLQRWVRDLDRARLPARAASELDSMHRVVDKLDRTLDELAGAGELIASAKRATDSVGEVGRTARTSARELERSLRDLGEAARAIHDLMDALEREPDMLVKGKARNR